MSTNSHSWHLYEIDIIHSGMACSSFPLLYTSGQINSQQKKMQEAMFEMITSEASYLKSLNVLVTHFVQCPEFAVDEGEDAVLTRRERHILFSDILPGEC